ncbi:MAG: hypothetical protein GXO76_00195 [Calditrichaeota bacterium]|nr:hypothetical protein [Calditrichota bacterium]
MNYGDGTKKPSVFSNYPEQSLQFFGMKMFVKRATLENVIEIKPIRASRGQKLFGANSFIFGQV